MPRGKKVRSTGFGNCTCSICGEKAHAKPGSQHRRCASSPNIPVRDKREKLPSAKRGTWS